MGRPIIYDPSYGHSEEEWKALSRFQRHHFKRREKRIAARKRWGKTNAEQRKEYLRKFYRKFALKKTYGLSEQCYENMLKSQKNCCAICRSSTPGRKRKYFCIDHDHETGAIRGLLCGDCNVALGCLKDSIDLCLNAAAYLKAYSK